MGSHGTAVFPMIVSLDSAQGSRLRAMFQICLIGSYPMIPLTLMAACEIMLWVSASVMIATFVPAWRVDPMVVLRSMIDRGNRLASPHPARHHVRVEQHDNSDHTRKQQAMLHRESEQP